MCIDVDGHHSGGNSIVNENDFVHMNEKTGTGVSSDKEQINESKQIVLRPGLRSDPPLGLDRDQGVT